jgi:hypothetical protein
MDHNILYPLTAGFKEESTSEDAALAIEQTGRAELLRHRAMEAIKASIFGFTADQAAEYMSESILAVRPRVSELYKRGLIKDTGLRRKNVSGVKAKVWVIA